MYNMFEFPATTSKIIPSGVKAMNYQGYHSCDVTISRIRVRNCDIFRFLSRSVYIILLTMQSEYSYIRGTSNLYDVTVLLDVTTNRFPGADPRGFGGQDPQPSFGESPIFKKREKTLHTCTRIHRVLVLDSYPYPALSEILYPPLFSPFLWSLGASQKGRS